MAIPDGHSCFELSKFITLPTLSDYPTAPVNSLGYLHIMFTIKDIEVMAPTLLNQGAILVGEIVQYKNSYRRCYIRDTEGILSGLAEPL